MMADVIMIVHLIWVIFMVLGLPLGLLLKNATLRWLHAAGMTLTVFYALIGAYCPLTVLEEQLRWGSDPGFSYGGSFIASRLAPILYPDVRPELLRWASITWFALTIGLLVVIYPGKPLLLKKK
jgi:hypothetical protein